jgi:hypothetical protein
MRIMEGSKWNGIRNNERKRERENREINERR